MTSVRSLFSLLMLSCACAAAGPATVDDVATLAALAAASGETTATRAAAIGKLGELGANATNAVAALSKLVLDADKHIGQPAARALLAVDSDAAVHVLSPMLADVECDLNTRAVIAVEYAGPPAIVFVPLLVDVLNGSPNSWTRAAAANGIGQVGPTAVEAVPDLVCGLTNKVEHVRRYCAKALGNIGPAAALAITALEQASRKTDDRRFCSEAVIALKKVRGE